MAAPTTNAARKQAARLAAAKPKKVKSPTGKPSKVRAEMKDFDAGKKVAGKRPTSAVKRKKVQSRSRAEKMDKGLPLKKVKK